MFTLTKHLDYPLTYRFDVEKHLSATYGFESKDFVPDLLRNSAQITLNLTETSSAPATFTHTFFEEFNGFNGGTNITILIVLVNEDGNVITHQEAGTHEERPLQGQGQGHS